MLRYTRVILLALFLLPTFIYASTTGKLSGIVLDKSSNDPLVGVNVTLEGTTLGASTDLDGYYVILNVPAGIYTVNFSYIGYQTLAYENIRVVPDITKRLDVSMEETSLELGEVVTVVAERPFFEVGATQTVRVLESDEIQRSPIKGIEKIVAINAGVVMADGSGGDISNPTINVRGGRGNETLIVVDGIPYNDQVLGGAVGTIPDAAIEQVSSQLGGFSAKYGNVQSGIVNIVTKGGQSHYFGSLEGVTSNSLDAYNYNQATGTLGGPLWPGLKNFDFFASGEYIKTDDWQPRSSGLKIPSAGIDQKKLPNNDGDVLRYVGKLNGQFGQLKATFSLNGSLNDRREYIHTYAKNNSEHNRKVEEDVLASSLKLSQVFSETAFLDVVVRYRNQKYQRGDGVWYDDLFAYGDSIRNQNELGVTLPGDGRQVLRDENGVFYKNGRVVPDFRKYRIETYGGDLNFTKQLKNHFMEIGGTLEQSKVRYFVMNPIYLMQDVANRTYDERFYFSTGFNYGYDIFGDENNSTSFRSVYGLDGTLTKRIEESGPKEPITGAAYFQDKIEFADFILNVGARFDYFDPKFKRIKNIHKVLGDDGILTEDDFEDAPTEQYVSPRVGFAYPVTERTVFHAQYGVFRQFPRFFDLYDSWINLIQLENFDGQGQNLGHLNAEETTQYEFGFQQQVGNVASLDITAFYKNVKGLTNVEKLTFQYGQTTKTVIGATNSDFGTVKGLAFQFNLRRIGPISTKIDYTLSLAEGTGSSQNSAFTAAFRNNNGETPTSISPLDFDQRHTLTANIDIRSGEKEGPLFGGFYPLENAGVNVLISYDSGRPYTPLSSVNILAGTTNFGEVTQYVNSAYAPGVFRIDLKVDKSFKTGIANIVPYLWIENLLDRENFIKVWGSTGEPDNTAFLTTPEGQLEIQSAGPGYAEDYKALERDPTNYGKPRTIRVGTRIEF